MTGWDPAFLQEAIDTCTNESGELSDCPLFVENGPLLSEDVQRECKFRTPLGLLSENAAGLNMAKLPGGIQIQDGPQSATPGSGPIDKFTSLIGDVFGGDSSTTTPSSPSVPSKPFTLLAVPTSSSLSTVSTSVISSAGGAFLESPSTPTPSTSSTPTSTPTPTTTSAPQVTSEPGVSYQVASTQTITNADGNVQEIVWMEPVVYVTEESYTTVTVPGSSQQKAKMVRDHVVKHRHHGHRGH
jgi:hypothetical protein